MSSVVLDALIQTNLELVAITIYKLVIHMPYYGFKEAKQFFLITDMKKCWAKHFFQSMKLVWHI